MWLSISIFDVNADANYIDAVDFGIFQPLSGMSRYISTVMIVFRERAMEKEKKGNSDMIFTNMKPRSNTFC